MDPDLSNLLRALGIGAATWLATAAVWVASGLAGDARRRRRRAARLARRKPAVAAAPPTVPAFADPMSCRWCNGRHATIDGANFCHETRHFRRDLRAWGITRRHLEYLKKTETLSS